MNVNRDNIKQTKDCTFKGNKNESSSATIYEQLF